MSSVEVNILKPVSESDYEIAAKLLTENEPWKTFGRSYEYSLKKVHDPDGELYLAKANQDTLGCILIQMKGQLKGFVRCIVVDESARSKGIGSKLLVFAEKRIFQDEKNVFMFVSSFNPKAKKLYLQLGYQEVGVFTNFVVDGYDEILLRKTRR